jgi:hypothetical protein
MERSALTHKQCMGSGRADKGPCCVAPHFVRDDGDRALIRTRPFPSWHPVPQSRPTFQIGGATGEVLKKI